MKNPMEVLRMKEQELLRIRKEVEALRIAAKLLTGESPSAADEKIDLRQVIEMP
jgi:hypothetical protein